MRAVIALTLLSNPRNMTGAAAARLAAAAPQKLRRVKPSVSDIKPILVVDLCSVFLLRPWGMKLVLISVFSDGESHCN
jgi:hypothetical protein